MEFHDILKEELKKFETSKDSSELIKNLQEGELVSLRKAIEDIEELIEKRQELNEELIDEIKSLSSNLKGFIQSLPTTITSEDSLKAQLELRKKLVELEEIRLQEKLNEWRDIAELKKELRERVKEYQEKAMRSDVIEQILEE